MTSPPSPAKAGLRGFFLEEGVQKPQLIAVNIQYDSGLKTAQVLKLDFDASNLKLRGQKMDLHQIQTMEILCRG